MLIVMVINAIPLALFARYWSWVNATVDDRTIPFSEAGIQNQLILLCAVALTLFTAVGTIAWFYFRGFRKTAFGSLVACIVVTLLLVPIVRSLIMSPVQGNAQAELHNDAAAIVANAVERFYSRTQEWPKNWLVLDKDLKDVLDEIKARRLALSVDHGTAAGPPSDDPFAAIDASSDLAVDSTNPFGSESAQSLDPVGDSSDPFANEESLAVITRAPDVSGITAESIRFLVDIDFESKPGVLAEMSWFEFTGIIPHKPAYNIYRVDFQHLINTLKKLKKRPDAGVR